MLVSAAMSADSVPHQALLKARATNELAMSQPVFEELRDVLCRPRLVRFVEAELRAEIIDQLVTGTLWFEPSDLINDCRDAADNKYLELALAAGADVIVSSDEDLLVLHPWRGIPILRPADYLVWDLPPAS